MDKRLENKCWNLIYREVGHPDEMQDLDWSSVEALEESLKTIYGKEVTLPRNPEPDMEYDAWIDEVIRNSVVCDKRFLAKVARKHYIKLLTKWAMCCEPDEPEVEEMMFRFAFMTNR